MDLIANHPRTVHATGTGGIGGAVEAEALALEPPATAERVDVAGQILTVFTESGQLIEAMAGDIAAAKRRVWVEVYTFYNDSCGVKIAEALKARAGQGLDVRVMFDAVGSVLTPWLFFDEMARAGVKVHEFHSFWEGLRRFRPLTLLNRRDHRKLVVVDDRVGYFGGMNIVDAGETVAQQKAEHRPTSSGWRDVHFRMEGPAQAELADSFERSWRKAHGNGVARRSRYYRRALQVSGPAAGRMAGRIAGRGAAPGGALGAAESIHFFDSGPGLKYSRASRIFGHLLRRAEVGVMISMAYFLPTGLVLRELLQARRRGVKVRVIVPGQSDVKLVQRATSSLYDRMIRRGFRIYERQRRMLHSKVMVVDDLYTVAGSCNMDPRSLLINLEFVAVIRSAKLAAAITRICRYELTHSQRITLARCRMVPWWQRFLNRMAWGLRWWL